MINVKDFGTHNFPKTSDIPKRIYWRKTKKKVMQDIGMIWKFFRDFLVCGELERVSID
jgi:hypothetical protein